jgi:hypothetical protein
MFDTSSPLMVLERQSSRNGLTQIAGVSRPVSLAQEQTLPVLPALEPVLPGGSLQRGYSLVVEGSSGASSLALALTAGPSKAGSWIAAIGVPALGMASASELGVVLEHLVLISPPAPKLWPTVAAALIDAFDLVLVGWPDVPRSMARRLGHRVRDRRAVLISVVAGTSHAWNEAADLSLRVTSARWQGIGWGDGRLQARHLVVETGGRRSAMPRKTALWLPDLGGGVAASDIQPAEHPVPQPFLSAGAGSAG